jgi:integrase/recombinase XerD
MKQQIQDFVEFLAAERRLSPNTLAAYKNDLRQFEEYLRARAEGPLGVEANGNGNGHGRDGDALVSREAVVGFFLSLREDKGYSAATIARKMAAVKALFQHLVRQGVITHNPAAELGSPEVKKPLPRAISVDDVDRLIQQVEKKASPEGLRDRAMLRLLYATGMRVTELVSLNVTDLDLDVAGGSVRCVGRSARVRQLPVEERSCQALSDYLKRGRPRLLRPGAPQEALFLNHRGQRLTRQGFWLIMKGVTRDSGVTAEVTPHTLRHSFATHRLSDGLTLPRLRELLGHANISTTQIYTQVAAEPTRNLVSGSRRLALAGTKR